MKKFIKNKEDFICENCGYKVVGNGYSNHCPNCFYSKHLDINPGDRLCDCQGMMKPINFFEKSGEMYVLHKCEKCGIEKKNKLAENDNRENMFVIMKKIAEQGEKYILENSKFNKLKTK